MQRVEALVQKLNSQLAQKAEKASLKQTVLEILTVLEETNDFTVLPNSISVLMPFQTEVEPKIEEQAPELVILQKPEVKDHITLEPIKNLASAIGINDKFLFIETLFLGDEKAFEESIKTINAFKIFQEAQFWIKQELRIKNNWDEASPIVHQFDQLVKRRFS
jgi:hypothetical protein